jgi:hypothetical protein
MHGCGADIADRPIFTSLLALRIDGLVTYSAPDPNICAWIMTVNLASSICAASDKAAQSAAVKMEKQQRTPMEALAPTTYSCS